MALYISIFIVGLLWGLTRLWSYLAEYEQSRPEHTIEAYIEHLNADFYSQMTQAAAGGVQLSEFETPDSILKTLNTDIAPDATYSWGKKGDTYTDDRPDYYIRYGNAAIASVALERVGGTPKFDFPIWRAVDPQTLIEISSKPEYELHVTLPAGANLTVNGVPVPISYMQPAQSPLELDETTLQYAAAPAAQSVNITGLFTSPAVQAVDAAGNPLEAVTEPGEYDKNQQYVYAPADAASPDPALVSRIEALTRAYVNYMINQDLDTWGNLYELEQYLVGNSTADSMMRSLVNDVYWNNDYTSREDKVLEISHVKMYSDTVCTCQAHFELQLTKNVVNDYVGTVEWTLINTDGTWNACNLTLLTDDSE